MITDTERQASPWPKRLFWALLVLKLLGLVVYGPMTQPDTGGYIGIGALLWETTDWVHDAGIDRYAVPPTIFRTLGYPAFVGGMIKLFGNAVGGYVVILAQIGLSMCATVWVYRLGRAMSKSWKQALIAAAGQALSIGFAYDQHILTDSSFNSLFLISFCWPLTRLLERKPATAKQLLALGLVYMLACSIRGIGVYFWTLILPGVFIWIFQDGFSDMGTKIKHGLAYLLLPVALISGTMAWNYHRTGYAVYCTGAQLVLIQAIMNIGKRGDDLFTTDQLIDRVAREKITDYGYKDVQAITYALFNEHGVNAIESAELHKAKFFQVLRDHPGKMLYHGIREYEEGLAHQFFDVGDNARAYFKYAAHAWSGKGMKKTWRRFRENPNLPDGLYVFGLSPLRVLAWFCLVVFILGPPIILGLGLRRGTALQKGAWRENGTLIYLWGIYFAYTYGLCVVHMVDRFMPAVLAAGLIPVLHTFKTIRDWRRERRRLEHVHA